MSENEVKNEVKSEAGAETKQESTSDVLKGKISSLLSSATNIGRSVVETAKDTVEKGKEVVEEHIREREANETYRKLGKKVYKLVSRDELKLPESCQKYIEALDDLYADDNSGDEACAEGDASCSGCCGGKDKDDDAK
ncbi:MAG: hypothetical protein FWC40_08195 [Proteobacteria bacterium]|nr:hypothetical protein [Pseudomonadota bacterium]